MPSNRQLFLQNIAQTSDIPLMLEIEKAEGSYLFDTSGKRYLDLIGGISVSVLGHRHPSILEAIANQLEKYLHTIVYGEYILSPQVLFAQLLTKHLNDGKIEQAFKNQFGGLDNVFFVNSGSEATEGAMKLAKRFTNRYEIISFKNAYHGSTQGAASLMSPAFFTDAYLPLLPGIRHLEFNNFDDLEFITRQTAAVIVEPVQSESGVTLPDQAFLHELRNRCKNAGALLIFDEAQTGFGRTGSMFAFQRFGVEPDMILLAKALGGGMPLGAFIAPKEISRHLSFDPPLGHITTFGGHPVSCTAGLAMLRTLQDSNLISEVPVKEKLFRELLVRRLIKEVRSSGLLMAVEIGDFQQVRKVMLDCLENGVVTDWFLFNDRCLRIAPPLTISENEIREACEVILTALDRL